MFIVVLSLALLAQAGSTDQSLQPEARAVKFARVADEFSRHNQVRLLPSRVYKVKVRGVSMDGITAQTLDPRDPQSRRTIVAEDLAAGADREWFEREALKLWKRNPTVDFLLDELVKEQIQKQQR